MELTQQQEPAFNICNQEAIFKSSSDPNIKNVYSISVTDSKLIVGADDGIYTEEFSAITPWVKQNYGLPNNAPTIVNQLATEKNNLVVAVQKDGEFIFLTIWV